MPEIATGWVTLVPSLKGFGKKVENDISGEAAETGKGFGKKMSEGIGEGAKEAIGGIFAEEIGARIGEFVHGSIEAASDLNETVSKTKVVFGDAAGEILNFSKGTAKSLGQTQQEALEAAGTFGVFGKAAGLTGSDLAGFSTKFTSLASDLASFHNTSPQEAIEAIGAALRGEAEPIRKYGVLLDDAALREEALHEGLIKTTKEALTPQQKTLAASALIFKQTKDAQGDFARTSDGLANSQRIMSASFEDAKAKLGTVLLPVLTVGTQVLGQFVGGMVDGTGAGGKFANVVGAIAKPLFDMGKFIVENWKALLVLATSLTLVNGVMIAHSTIMSIQAAGSMKAWIAQTKIGTTVSKAFAAVQWLVDAALDANPITLIIIGLAALALGMIVAYKKSETFRKIVDGAFGLLKSFGHFIVGSLVGAFSAASGALQKVSGFFGSAGGAISNADGKVRHFQQTVEEKIGAALRFLGGVPAKIQGVFDGAATWLLQTGKDIISGLISGIKDMASSLVSTIESFVIDKIPGPLKKALGINSPSKVTREIGHNVMDGLTKGIADRSKDLKKKVQEQIDGLKSQLQTLRSDLGSLASGVAGAFTKDLFSDNLTNLLVTGEHSVANLQQAIDAFDALKGRANKGFLSSLFSSGNVGLAVQLANADDATLKQAEDLFSKQNALAGQLGDAVGLNQFGDKIDDVRDEIKKLRKDLKHSPHKTGKAVADALNKVGSDVQRNRRK